MYAPLRIAAALDGGRATTSGSPPTTRSPAIVVDEPGYAVRQRHRPSPPTTTPPTGQAPRLRYNVGRRRLLRPRRSARARSLRLGQRRLVTIVDGRGPRVADVARRLGPRLVAGRPPRPSPAHRLVTELAAHAGVTTAVAAVTRPNRCAARVRQLPARRGDVAAHRPLGRRAGGADVEEREEADPERRGATTPSRCPVEYQPERGVPGAVRPRGAGRHRAGGSRTPSASSPSWCWPSADPTSCWCRWPGRARRSASCCAAGPRPGTASTLPHYAVSIVRDRGIDTVALRHLAAHHDPATVRRSSTAGPARAPSPASSPRR